MTWKSLTPAEAAALVQPGQVVLASSGAALPFGFLEALGNRRDLKNVKVYSSLGLEPLPWQSRVLDSLEVEASSLPYRPMSFGPGPGERGLWERGLLELIPLSAGLIKSYFMESQRFDYLVISSAQQDSEGFFNAGTNNDWVLDLLPAAEAFGAPVIVEVNRHMPATSGETSFPQELVAYVTEHHRPLPEYLSDDFGQVGARISQIINDLIPDAATISMSMGGLVNQVVRSLSGKKDLGVFSEFLGDAFLQLHRAGALTNERRGFLGKSWIGAFAMGSRDFYSFLNKNPLVELRPSEFIGLQTNIQRNNCLCAISGALEVDLFGQVVSDALGYRQISGPGLQRDLHRAASLTRGKGRGIVVLPSIAGQGHSRIVTALTPGSAVTISRADVDTIVTEHGIVRLKGRSLRERARDLIRIAAPMHRDSLTEQARKFGLL